MELTIEEVTKHIKFIINNNRILQDSGRLPIAVNVVGEAGVGKTSCIEQIANELDCNFIKLNLSQISDPSDIIGFPLKEHYICKSYPDHPEDDECKWIPGELIEAFSKAGGQLTEETRMSYAVPMWLKTIDINKPTILCLDDYARCTPAIAQAVMEIICRQEYVSWKLPKYTTVICSSNPDSGSYNVETFDEAQQSRLVNFSVKFDSKVWAKWAEENNIDGRAINFLLTYGDELMDRTQAKVAKVNARNYTMFANIIGGIEDWSTPENLALILQIASGCFLDEDDLVGGLFTTFIANKLDKLLSPEDLVTKDWNYVKGVLEKQLYDGDKYRADIASVITTRFINYSIAYFRKPEAKTDIVINRILSIVENDKLLLSEDLIFNLVKTLNKNHPRKCSKLLLNPKLAQKLI